MIAMRNVSPRVAFILAGVFSATLLPGCSATEPSATPDVKQPTSRPVAGVPAEEALGLEIALTAAAWYCDVAAVRLLLDAGADPEGVSGTKTRRYLRANGLPHLELDPYVSPSPLIASLAIDYDNPDAIPAADRAAVVNLLLDAGADPDIQLRTSFGVFPLLLAVEQGNDDAVRHLLNAGADPNLSLEGFTQIDIHRGDSATALDEAVASSDLTIARLLLDAGANPLDGGFVLVPMTRAAYMADPEMLALLLESAAADGHGYWFNSALHDTMNELIHRWGIASGALEVQEQELADCRACFDLLVTHHAHADVDNDSVGFAAPMIRDPEFRDWYLEELIRFDSASTYSYEWMSDCIASGDLDGLRNAHEAGLDVNAVGEYGQTLLHHAAGVESIAVVYYLIEEGAWVNARNDDGYTPLDWVNDDAVVTALREAGGRTGDELAGDDEGAQGR